MSLNPPVRRRILNTTTQTSWWNVLSLAFQFYFVVTTLSIIEVGSFTAVVQQRISNTQASTTVAIQPSLSSPSFQKQRPRKYTGAGSSLSSQSNNNKNNKLHMLNARSFGDRSSTQRCDTASGSSSSTTATSEKSNDIGYELIEKEYYDIVKVDLDGGRDYPIYIGTGYSDDETSTLLLQHIKGKKVLIVTNDKIAPMGYLEQYTDLLRKGDVTKIIDTLVIPDGEEYKNMEILNTILDKCLDMALDRQSVLVALGGGVIGDMVGFAAAIYVRGIQFVQIPTTVMSMVDSSVGGKTGVNHPSGKNMIGSFHQPQCVFIDTASLLTLPDRELASGISEIVKYGLIRDYDLLVWLEENMDKLLARDPIALRYAITRSCQNKAAVVKADEKEAGNIRATLNLGHTFGHAIENGCGYGVYLHGEAVSIGIVMAARLSARMGWITDTDVVRITTLLQRANLPVQLQSKNTPMTREMFLQLMSVDKKVTNGQLRLILLQGPLGNCVFTSDFDQDAMVQVIDEFIADAASTVTSTTTSSVSASDDSVLVQSSSTTTTIGTTTNSISTTNTISVK